MATVKYIFTVSNGQLLVKLNNVALEFEGDNYQTYKSPTLVLFKNNIKLSDFGIFINSFKIENFDTINGVVPADIEDAFALLLALLPSAGGGGGSGDASASNQVLQTAKLTSIDTKLDQLHTDMIAPIPIGTNSIGQVTANAGTNLNTSALSLEATQLLIKAKTDNLDVAQSTRASESTLSTINTKLPTLVNNTQPTSLSGINFAFSTVNSSVAQLASLATFTGTIEDTKNQPSISLLMVSDQNMVITVLQYIDLAGTKLVSSTPFTVYAGNQLAKSFPINGNYVKVTARNIGASTTTTFQLDTAYGIIDTSDGSSNIPVSQAQQFASGNITTQNLVANGVATANSAVEVLLNGASNLSIQTTGTYTGALSLQVTNDNVRWETVTGALIYNSITGLYSATITSASIGIFSFKTGAFYKARVTGLSAMTGTCTVTLRANNSSSISTLDSAIPVGTNSIGNIGTVATVTTLSNGQTAHSSAVTGSPLRIAGKVVPTIIATQDTTLVAGDASDVGITTSLQQIVKNNATSELDFNFIFSSIVTTVTPQTVVQASGTALIRNYIKSLRVSTDTLGVAGNIWLLDGALAVSSIAITTGLVTTSVAHDLKIGDAVVFTALASGTGVTTNTLYYVTAVGSTTTFNFALTVGGANVVPSVAYTGTTVYRMLDQIRVQTASMTSTMFLYDEPLKTNPNMAVNLLIPTTLVSGSIYITVNGYRGF